MAIDPLRKSLTEGCSRKGVRAGAEHGTKIEAGAVSSVSRSWIGTVSPAQFTNVFSPARCSCRSTTRSQSRKKKHFECSVMPRDDSTKKNVAASNIEHPHAGYDAQAVYELFSRFFSVPCDLPNHQPSMCRAGPA